MEGNTGAVDPTSHCCVGLVQGTLGRPDWLEGTRAVGIRVHQQTGRKYFPERGPACVKVGRGERDSGPGEGRSVIWFGGRIDQKESSGV